MMPRRLYAYRFRDARDSDKEWHSYPYFEARPEIFLCDPGPLACDERYDVQLVCYTLDDDDGVCWEREGKP